MQNPLGYALERQCSGPFWKFRRSRTLQPEALQVIASPYDGKTRGPSSSGVPSSADRTFWSPKGDPGLLPLPPTFPPSPAAVGQPPLLGARLLPPGISSEPLECSLHLTSSNLRQKLAIRRHGPPSTQDSTISEHPGSIMGIRESQRLQALGQAKSGLCQPRAPASEQNLILLSSPHSPH